MYKIKGRFVKFEPLIYFMNSSVEFTRGVQPKRGVAKWSEKQQNCSNYSTFKKILITSSINNCLLFFPHSILLFTIMVDKMELRNSFFSVSFPISPPTLGNNAEKFFFSTSFPSGLLETMILLFPKNFFS